jgi:hypothetical protein
MSVSGVATRQHADHFDIDHLAQAHKKRPVRKPPFFSPSEIECTLGCRGTSPVFPANPLTAPVYRREDHHLAKPNYQFEKRQRDLAKKKKQEEKRLKKQQDKTDADALDPSAAPASAEDAPPAS